LSWKKVKKLLGKANPVKRKTHIESLAKLEKQARDGEIILLYVDQSHFHCDMDLGYTWGFRGQRIWRRSGCQSLSARINWYGAYDYCHGECLIWHEGRCNGENTCKFLRRIQEWRAGKTGRLVIIWDNAPCQRSKKVQQEASELGIELVFLPGYSPDLNPIERLWDWMREEVTRGHSHNTLKELNDACQEFIKTINQEPAIVVDRLWPKHELDPDHEAKLSVPA